MSMNADDLIAFLQKKFISVTTSLVKELLISKLKLTLEKAKFVTCRLSLK